MLKIKAQIILMNILAVIVFMVLMTATGMFLVASCFYGAPMALCMFACIGLLIFVMCVNERITTKLINKKIDLEFEKLKKD